MQNYDCKKLSKYTTLVSANYVYQALQGNFSSVLWHFLTSFNKPNNFFKALRNLLNCGHFSGADTLLGVYLALKYLNLKALNQPIY